MAANTSTAPAPEAHPDLRHLVFEAEGEIWAAEDLVEAACILFERVDAPLTKRRRSAIARVLLDAKSAVEVVRARWQEIDAIVKGQPLDDGTGEGEEAAGEVTGADHV